MGHTKHKQRCTTVLGYEWSDPHNVTFYAQSVWNTEIMLGCFITIHRVQYRGQVYEVWAFKKLFM